MVGLLKERGMVQPMPGSATCLGFFQAAWQCIRSLQAHAAAGSAGEDRAASAAVCELLRSPAACQVLSQQLGGTCSTEEVCGVLVRSFKAELWSIGVVEIAVVLLWDPARLQVALAVPGFAAALIAYALGPRSSQYDSFVRQSLVNMMVNVNGLDEAMVNVKASLLEVLVSHVSGRAALVAQMDALGHLAYQVVTVGGSAAACSPHLTQLWAAGAEEGLAEAMVAGLAAGEEGWVKFFGWVVKVFPLAPFTWDGLAKALTGAFGLAQRQGDPMPLEKVLLWLLEGEGGLQLLCDCPELEEAVSAWLQRTASPQRHSPLVPLLVLFDMDTPGAADALAYLASSPVLARGALLSLVTCRLGWHADSSIGRWVAQHKELQQQVLGDRCLLCTLLRATAAAWSTAGEAQEALWNTSAADVLMQLPVSELVPQLVELLVGQGSSSISSSSTVFAGANQAASGSAAAMQDLAEVLASSRSSSSIRAAASPPAAAGSTPDVQLVAGAWLALELIRRDCTGGEQLVLEAMQQMAQNAAQVDKLQQLEAAGHAALVAAAQAQHDLIADQQKLQRQQEALAAQQLRMDACATAQQQQLQQVREAVAVQQQLLDQERAAIAAQQQQLEQDRQALRLERQQLEQLREAVGPLRKRRQ
jgi:hypothetical protein